MNRPLIREAVETTGRTVAWFGVPVLLAVEWTRFGWRWTLVLTGSHALALLAGVLVKDRVKAQTREVLDYLGDWAEARKGADLVRDHRDETGQHTVVDVSPLYDFDRPETIPDGAA